MRTPGLATFALLLSLSPALWAVDDGQTRPRLSYNNLGSPNSSIDIIGTTNGSGNVKGVYCQFTVSVPVVINFYVDGGAAQSITLFSGYFPVDDNLNGFTGWIPYNVRFSSSIRVQMQRAMSPVIYGDTGCLVSWALD
jgi:hypothetical protein